MHQLLIWVFVGHTPFCWFCHEAAHHVWPWKVQPVFIFPFSVLERERENYILLSPKTSSMHPPSLIRVFFVRMTKAYVLSYPLSAQRKLWSDWADAQADLSLRWAHMPFCWFCHEAAHVSWWCSMYLRTFVYLWKNHLFMSEVEWKINDLFHPPSLFFKQNNKIKRYNL